MITFLMSLSYVPSTVRDTMENKTQLLIPWELMKVDTSLSEHQTEGMMCRGCHGNSSGGTWSNNEGGDII